MILSRPVKGTGSWSTSYIDVPSGAANLWYAHMMTNGANHNNIHIITATNSAYKGMQSALLYYRSTDGGVTWDKQAVILPGLDSTNYDVIYGDYCDWGSPHGDTIYFAQGSPWTDTFIMKSNDNGETWAKIPVLSNANSKVPAGTTYLPHFRSADGAVAVELDRSGILHLAFGIGGGYMTNGTRYISGNLDRLVYWNSTMGMLKDSLDLDTLAASGQLLSKVVEGPGPGDTLKNVYSYRIGMTSQPQITVDVFNNIYFLWSQVVAGHPNPVNQFNYRHLWSRAKFRDHSNMSPAMDLHADTNLYLYNEFVYPSMAKNIRNDSLFVLFQNSTVPGSSYIQSSIPYHDVAIRFRRIAVTELVPVAIENAKPASQAQPGQFYPDPADDLTRIEIMLSGKAMVSAEVWSTDGRCLGTVFSGSLPQGKHFLDVKAANFPRGIYLCMIRVNADRFIRKFAVR